MPKCFEINHDKYLKSFIDNGNVEKLSSNPIIKFMKVIINYTIELRKYFQ